MNQIKQSLKAILRYIDSLFARAGSTINRVTRESSRSSRPANQARRLYIDSTYIYSTNINTGIQRVVRNIIKRMEPHTNKKGLELVTAALVNGAFVEIDRKELERFNSQSNLRNLLQRVERKIKLYCKSFFAGEKLYEDDIVLMLDSSWHLHVWPSVEYAKKRGAKIIGVAYDLIPITHPQFCDDVMEQYFTNWYRRSTDYFDGYISISQTVMEDLVHYLEALNSTNRQFSFDSFTLGADFETDYSGNKKVRESLLELYQNTNRSIYLTVSTIEPRKNHRFVYEAFKLLWENGFNISWIIVGGSGWKTGALQREMREDKAYQDKLWIFNDLNDAELSYCYRHSKALVFPSIIEGYGLPIIESLKNGLPVLASDTPIHREVGEERVTYFDLARPESLSLLIENIERGEKVLKSIDTNSIPVPTWSQSAEELLNKTIFIADHKNKRSGT
ncbi:MAG: glycosyltransferase family 1 protein [Campylobacterota bacterium]|nr:glycosyltransferase family 1 protein [Campylobacterota bacterium]